MTLFWFSPAHGLKPSLLPTMQPSDGHSRSLDTQDPSAHRCGCESGQKFVFALHCAVSATQVLSRHLLGASVGHPLGLGHCARFATQLESIHRIGLSEGHLRIIAERPGVAPGQYWSPSTVKHLAAPSPSLSKLPTLTIFCLKGYVPPTLRVLGDTNIMSDPH